MSQVPMPPVKPNRDVERMIEALNRNTEAVKSFQNLYAATHSNSDLDHKIESIEKLLKRIKSSTTSIAAIIVFLFLIGAGSAIVVITAATHK